MTITTSKPPTRRITVFAALLLISVTSKPPTRRITRVFENNILIFQQIVFQILLKVSFW